MNVTTGCKTVKCVSLLECIAMQEKTMSMASDDKRAMVVVVGDDGKNHPCHQQTGVRSTLVIFTTAYTATTVEKKNDLQNEEYIFCPSVKNSIDNGHAINPCMFSTRRKDVERMPLRQGR